MEKILIIDDSIVHAHYLKSILEDSYEISSPIRRTTDFNMPKPGSIP